MNALCYTDLRAAPDQLFWQRDLGLLTKAFRGLGHDAWLFVHPATKSTRHDSVIWASPSNAFNPSWGQSQKLNLILFGLWTGPKYDPIRRAALSGTPRIVARADGDGMRTASCGLSTYARRRFDNFRDLSGSWPSWLSTLAAVATRSSRFLRPPGSSIACEKPFLVPCLTLKTPQSLRRWQALARRIGAGPARMLFGPNPVQARLYQSKSSVQKIKSSPWLAGNAAKIFSSQRLTKAFCEPLILGAFFKECGGCEGLV